MERNSAEALAAEVFAWLAEDPDLLGVFLGATGTAPADLGAQSGTPEFLASVLDFLLMDDAWIAAFCEARNHAYEAPMRARLALPGGETMHWT